MKRQSLWVGVGIVGGGIFLVGVLVFLVRREPEFYRRMAVPPGEERRQRWEPEYHSAVETWHARELQASQRLSDEPETEFQQALSDTNRTQR